MVINLSTRKVFSLLQGKKVGRKGGKQKEQRDEKESQICSVQMLSRVRLFAAPWTAARQASPSITNSRRLLRLMSIESVMPSNHPILCCPLLLPSIFPSIRVFSNESALPNRQPKYWSFSFRISSSNEYSKLISFRIDWLDLLAVQGTLKTLLQDHSSKRYFSLQPLVKKNASQIYLSDSCVSPYHSEL